MSTRKTTRRTSAPRSALASEILKVSPESPECSVRSGPALDDIYAEARTHRVKPNALRLLAQVLLVTAQATHRTGKDGRAWLKQQAKASKARLDEHPSRSQWEHFLAVKLAMAQEPKFTRAGTHYFQAKIRRAVQGRPQEEM